MTMGTRIILLDGGVIQQDGTPKEIYDRPANTFVARFIGSPPMNLFPARVRAGGIELADGSVLDSDDGPAFLEKGSEVVLGVRAEKISIARAGRGLPARVAIVERLGAETVVGFRWGDAMTGKLGASVARDLYYARIPGDVDLAVGDACRVQISMAGASWFDSETGTRLSSVRDLQAAG